MNEASAPPPAELWRPHRTAEEDNPIRPKLHPEAEEIVDLSFTLPDLALVVAMGGQGLPEGE